MYLLPHIHEIDQKFPHKYTPLNYIHVVIGRAWREAYLKEETSHNLVTAKLGSPEISHQIVGANCISGEPSYPQISTFFQHILVDHENIIFFNFLQKFSYCQINMSGLQSASVNLVRNLMRSLRPQSASLHQKHWRQPQAFRSSIILYSILDNLIRRQLKTKSLIFTSGSRLECLVICICLL